MIFYVIGFYLVVYGIANYKKGFFCYLIFRLFLVQNITMISVPGVPLLTLDVFLSLFYVGLYFIRKNDLYEDKSSFPFRVPFIFLFLSWTVSAFFSIVGFGSAMSQYLRDVCQNLILIFIMWRLITSKKDFLWLFVGFNLVMLISCLYGIFEGTIQSNPLADYEATFNSDDSKLINYDYSEDKLRGYRIKSIFEHAIGAGVMWCITIVLALYFWIDGLIKKGKKVSILFLILLCIICLALTKSRGPILFLIISSLGIIQLNSKKFYYAAIFGTLLIIIGWSFFSQFGDTFLSIFSSKAQENVGGSNADMRLEQLEASFLLMQGSPFFGLGFKYQNVIDNYLTDLLRGSESMWFSILPQFGLLGIVAYLFFAYYSIYKIPKDFHSKRLLFFSLAYWIVASLTSVPGLKMHYYFFCVLYIIKQSKLYKYELSPPKYKQSSSVKGEE